MASVGSQLGDGGRREEGSTTSSPVVTKDPPCTNEMNTTNNNENDKNDNKNNTSEPRRRHCTEKGLAFFREESLKNRATSHRAIQGHAERIEELLQSGSVEEAAVVYKALEKSRKEFARAHSRVLGLGEDTEDDQNKLASEVHDLVEGIGGKLKEVTRVAEQRECQGRIEELVEEVLCLPWPFSQKQRKG